MNNTPFFVAALLLAAGTAQAQLNAPSPLAVGFKAGGAVTSLVGGSSAIERSTYGFQAGLAFQVGARRGFYLQPELLYSQKGGQRNETNFSLTRHLNYLDVPVAFRYQPGNWFGEVGPQVGFLLSANESRTDGGEKVKATNSYQSVDAGYLLGLGYQPVRGGLGFGLRYNGGFSKVAEATSAQNLSNPNARNSAFQVYATYFFAPRRRH